MRTVIHICCGVCAAGAASTLLGEGHDVRGFFYNPNIHPRDEYLRRLSAAQAVAAQLHFTVEVPAYQHRDWSDLTAPLAGREWPVPAAARQGDARPHGQGVDLGTFGDGPQPVLVSVTAGATHAVFVGRSEESPQH